MTKKIWKQQGNALLWEVQPGAVHQDNYEMSGLLCDTIVEYGVDAGGMLALRWCNYVPTLRTIPNDTHATLEICVDRETLPGHICNGEPLREFPKQIWLDGTLTVESEAPCGVTVKRQFFPTAAATGSLQVVTLQSRQAVSLTVTQPQTQILSYVMGTKGTYVSRLRHTAPETLCLQPGQSYEYCVYFSSAMANGEDAMPSFAEERQNRYRRIRQLCDDALVLSTGAETLDAMTRFANLRAGESIFQTLSGKFHSPGGRRYYAAVWCNDQVEYVGPHAAMTGDAISIEAALNAYRAYVPFMADNYAPIPSSVISEGLDIWNGAGDRGDAAMYLYGASLFALYLGDRKVAEELYRPVKWCAEYCQRQRTPEGVIRSKTDELEGRIPTDGYANLSTSCLCYGGLQMAAKLADALEDEKTAACYRERAAELKTAIEAYFGAELHGYRTYRYSKGFDTLRSWICLPLCVDILDRAEGTLDAMLSPYLWTEEGMLSCELSSENRDSTIWDRSTLYGLKAAFRMGEGDRIWDAFMDYCSKRLLCDRVPYAVEAYPEGAKRHLSGESALFVRVITEGLLSIQPESLDSFSFVPRLPKALPYVHLSKLWIAGHSWNIRVEPESWAVERDGEMVQSGKTDGIRVQIGG